MRTSLGEALERAQRGDGSVVVLTGEPGIGKTTIARDVADRARRAGVSVRWAACWPGGGTVAHGPWLTVLAGLGAAGEPALAALAGATVDGTAAATSARASAYASVGAALERAAADRPFVVVLDDLHWADEGTVQLLAAVAGQVPALPVLIVAAYRDTEVAPGSPLTQLTSSADRMALHGLDEAGVEALLSEPLGREHAARVAAEVRQRTGGNPFLVIQLGRLLAAEPGGLDRRELPTGARDLLAGRLAALGPTDRSVLVAAAVLGAAFAVPDLSAILEIPPDDVASALDHAATLRVVQRSAGVGSWAFVHELFREATLDPVADAERRDLHRRAAAALVAVHAEPAAIAHHLLAAHRGRSTEAARWSARAGDRALGTFAWEEAAAHYERALAALGNSIDDDAVRADALVGLGQARQLVGDAQGAGRAFEEAAAVARRTGSTELMVRAALGFSADLSGFEVRLFEQRQIDLLEEAAEQLAGSSLDGLRATVLARLSVALSLSAPSHRRLALAETAVALAAVSTSRSCSAGAWPPTAMRSRHPTTSSSDWPTRPRSSPSANARTTRHSSSSDGGCASSRSSSSVASARQTRRRGRSRGGLRRSGTRSTPGTYRSGPGNAPSSRATCTRATSRSTRPASSGVPWAAPTRRC